MMIARTARFQQSSSQTLTLILMSLLCLAGRAVAEVSRCRHSIARERGQVREEVGGRHICLFPS